MEGWGLSRLASIPKGILIGVMVLISLLITYLLSPPTLQADGAKGG